MRAGDRVPFVLTWRRSHEATPTPVDPESALADTIGFWSQWSGQAHAHVRGPYRDAVQRSLVTLKL